MLIKHIRIGNHVVIGDLAWTFVRVELTRYDERGDDTFAAFDVEGLYGVNIALGKSFDFKSRGSDGELHEVKVHVRELRPTYVEIAIDAPREVRIS